MNVFRYRECRIPTLVNFTQDLISGAGLLVQEVGIGATCRPLPLCCLTGLRMAVTPGQANGHANKLWGQ
jgi:hypothetical protein